MCLWLCAVRKSYAFGKEMLSNTHTQLVECWGWAGRASSGLIKSSRDSQSRLAACQPTCLLFLEAQPCRWQFSSLHISLVIDIYNCHSCLPKCETPAEQLNDFLLCGAGLKMFFLISPLWLIHNQLYVQLYSALGWDFWRLCEFSYRMLCLWKKLSI